MSHWKVIFSDDGRSDLNKLSRSVRDKIIEKLEWFESNFDFMKPLPLTGEFKGFYKLRVGDWRVVYKINWDKNYVVVHIVDHRSNIYK